MTAPTTAAAPRPAEGFDVSGRSVYMIGIGGCGMAGLARMLKARGARVSGSDGAASETTALLGAEGIAVGVDETAAALPARCDLLVASAAIRPDHPLLLEAQRRSVPTHSYAEALGRCMAGRSGVAVAGTHGKSTTTAMLGAALTDAGLDPTVIVGATCGQLVGGCLAEKSGGAGAAGGFRLGSDTIPRGPLAGRPGLLVAEACEFNRSFHNYRPLVASISSVEADHLDVYGTLDAVIESFHEFAGLVAPAEAGGRLLIAHDGASRLKVTAGVAARVETIGFSPEADWVVSFDPPPRRVQVRSGGGGGETVAQWPMVVPGAHNAMNAATACTLAVMVGAEPGVVARSLAAFRGVDRRMQFLGARDAGGGSVRVFDDYGHHPTEVAATLRALRDFERPQDRGGRLICVFQPHQHSRTRHLMEEFATAFSDADVVIVPQIYFVRDSQEERHRVTAADLVDRLRQRGTNAMHLHPFEAIVEQLGTLCRGGDAVVVMGAGPVWQVGRAYLARKA
ncbi:MAG: Mur ligase domain-containing protein [Phycisphaerales bacterium]